MRNTRGLHRKGLAEREEKERVLSSERAHKKVLTVKKNMHLILNSGEVTSHPLLQIKTLRATRFFKSASSSRKSKTV